MSDARQILEAMNRSGGLLNLFAVDKREPASAWSFVRRVLNVVRNCLDMDAALVSEFVGDRAVIRVISGPGHPDFPDEGESMPLTDAYCYHVHAGHLPEMIADMSAIRNVELSPRAQAIPVGSHIAVPIRTADGSVFGMMSSFGVMPNPALRPSDVHLLQAFADLSATEIERHRESRQDYLNKRDRIRAVLDGELFDTVYQPIWNVERGVVAGVEALTRVTLEPARPPDQWFAEAGEVGLSGQLELATVRNGCRILDRLPPDVYLSVNASPSTLADPRFQKIFEDEDPGRFVVEITEHETVEDYRLIKRRLRPLRNRGLRVAIDDAGAGYASLKHVLEMEPDIIKLDTALIRSIDRDAMRQALAVAMVRFCQETGTSIVAEGVETEKEFNVLRDLGVRHMQGYLMGRPDAADRILGRIDGAFSLAAPNGGPQRTGENTRPRIVPGALLTGLLDRQRPQLPDHLVLGVRHTGIGGIDDP
ncbi:MAG: EAL domain-containing protein [Minwuia sp.]|uniref:sensor domain-containing phosphodiesterase n=1 Tax=Minwuia sp. TaxID=2493630 RepID=UPI003A89AB3F